MSQDDLLAKTLSVVAEVDPHLAPSQREDREGTYLDLPAPRGADYRFSLYTGEPQILATLLPPNEARDFWYWPFEEEDYSTTAEQEGHFFSCVRLILMSSTRITQRRGLLGTSFHCEAIVDGSAEPIGSGLGVTFWFRVPRIAGRRHVWTSPPVVAR